MKRYKMKLIVEVEASDEDDAKEQALTSGFDSVEITELEEVELEEDADENEETEPIE